MSSPTKVISSLFKDGFKALGAFSWALSIAFTICKIFGVVGTLRQIDYAWALLPITAWLVVAYIRRLSLYDDQIEAPRASALALSSMHVTEIAEHILIDSEWGWRSRLRLSLKVFVKGQVAFEMTRAGRDNEVRYIGTPPNTDVPVEIPRTYWRFAQVDDDRIWDRRNNFFTEVLRTGTPVVGGSFCYQFGSAPRIDVMRTWPRASALLRV